MVLGTDYFRTKPLSHSTYIFQVSGFGHSRAEPEEIGRARDSESAGFGDDYLSRNDEQPMKFHMEKHAKFPWTPGFCVSKAKIPCNTLKLLEIPHQ